MSFDDVADEEICLQIVKHLPGFHDAAQFGATCRRAEEARRRNAIAIALDDPGRPQSIIGVCAQRVADLATDRQFDQLTDLEFIYVLVGWGQSYAGNSRQYTWALATRIMIINTARGHQLIEASPGLRHQIDNYSKTIRTALRTIRPARVRAAVIAAYDEVRAHCEAIIDRLTAETN